MNIISAMEKRAVKRLNCSGQAAAEYLLTLTAVFIAFAGVSSLFSKQIDKYLTALFQLICLPF